ncbi:MAG: protein phosphatase 2C domain-containing protein [Acidobacteriota bacterium]
MIQSFRVTSASVSDRGLSEKRPQNEDAFLEIPQSGIFAVADGVGGAQAGEVASQMAMEILGEAFINVDERADAEQVMRRALMQANSAINQMSHELPQLAQMATTVVALHIADNIATIGHAGDSRLYRLDGEGVLHRETDDHSVVAEEVRAGRMTEEQAENHPGKNIISRALGAEATVEIDTKTIMVGENSTFLICSDGVTRHIKDAEIMGLLGAQADPQEICDRIRHLCFERGAEDNLTAVIVRLRPLENAVKHVVSESTISDGDEVTVATARMGSDKSTSDYLEDDDLLEIQSDVRKLPSSRDDEPELFFTDSGTSNTTVFEDDNSHDGEKVGQSSVTQEEPAIVDELSSRDSNVQSSPFIDTEDHLIDAGEVLPEPARPIESERPAFKQDAEGLTQVDERSTSALDNRQARNTESNEAPASTLKMLSAIALLLIGSLIGLGAYHFFLTDRSLPVTVPPITEMRSSSQPQTAFEENRRTLDKNPEAALPRYEAEPKDAENQFLVGRANLLLGRYPEARKALQESRDLIAAGQVDPDNAQTIKTEIAIELAVTNDTLVQSSLRKELDEIKSPPAASNVTQPNR